MVLLYARWRGNGRLTWVRPLTCHHSLEVTGKVEQQDLITTSETKHADNEAPRTSAGRRGRKTTCCRRYLQDADLTTTHSSIATCRLTYSRLLSRWRAYSAPTRQQAPRQPSNWTNGTVCKCERLRLRSHDTHYGSTVVAIVMLRLMCVFFYMTTGYMNVCMTFCSWVLLIYLLMVIFDFYRGLFNICMYCILHFVFYFSSLFTVYYLFVINCTNFNEILSIVFAI